MERKSFFVIALLLITGSTLANTIVVDKNGGGQFTSIQSAITNAVPGDTIKVWPGEYTEQLIINKDLVIMGSGYEYTIIRGNSPAITMSAGKFMWFQVTTDGSYGISMSGGTVANCVIENCHQFGIVATSGTSIVTNCVLYNNGTCGLHGLGGIINATNCIGKGHADTDFNEGIYLSYSLGSCWHTSGNQGVITGDPLFNTSTDFHISQGSPCWNTGNTSLFDPDGSISDMGYFGGTDCPIYPTVYEIIITPNGNNINLEAKGRANY
jgi:hypothetical protein